MKLVPTPWITRIVPERPLDPRYKRQEGLEGYQESFSVPEEVLGKGPSLPSPAVRTQTNSSGTHIQPDSQDEDEVHYDDEDVRPL